MSSDVAIFDDELKSLAEQIQTCLRAMDTLSGDARLAKYNKAQDLLKMAQKNFHHFKVEIRQLDPPESAIYEKKVGQHNQMLNSLKEQLTAKRNESASPAGGGAAAASYGSTGREDDGKGQARQTKDRIANTQAAALASLERTEAKVEETKEIGAETADTLAKQTEQMQRMNQKLDHLDSEVDRAKGELNAFIRRMMTDKIILCFILLVIIAVITIVIIKLKDPDAVKFESPPAPPVTPAPPTPSPPPGPSPTGV